jgi:hypothetical protein
LILTLAWIASGCYQYFPVEEAAPLPEPGAEVRARLAAPQPLELGSVTIHDVSTLEGDVYRSDGDTLAVFSRRIISTYGFRQHTNGAVFYFDRSQFGRLEQRKLVPVKSAIAASAIAAGVVLGLYYALDLGGGAEGPGTGAGQVFGRTVGIPLNWIIP